MMVYTVMQLNMDGYLGYWPSQISIVDEFAYIGLEFNYNGGTYYGWIKLKTDGKSFTIQSYAWNQAATSADKCRTNKLIINIKKNNNYEKANKNGYAG